MANGERQDFQITIPCIFATYLDELPAGDAWESLINYLGLGI